MMTVAELTDEQIAQEEKFLEGIPRLNIGALFLPPIWGPAHGIWITILWYPVWLFAAAVIECGMVLRDSKYAGTASLRDAKALLDDLALARNDPKADFERLLQTL